MPVRIVILAALAVCAWAHAPQIGLAPASLDFFVAPGASAVPPRSVVLTNETHGKMPWYASVSTASGGSWLRVSPANGELPGLVEVESTTLTITVTPGSVAAGVYAGLITINAPGGPDTVPASNTPQSIPITLVVAAGGQAPLLRLSSSAIRLTGIAGLGQTSVANISVGNAGSGTIQWTASVSTDSGGPWLSCVPSTGSNATPVTVNARVGSLAAGTYTGRITVNAPGAANPREMVDVTYVVRDPTPASFQVQTVSLSFTAVTGDPDPPVQGVVFGNGGEAPLKWHASASTFNGGPWIALASEDGSGAATIGVTAHTGALPPGNYAGSIVLLADGVPSVRVSITFTVQRQKPLLSASGVVNGANLAPSLTAPGSIVTLFGSRLGPPDPVPFAADRGTGNAPLELAGVKVSFDGVPAPLLFVSDKQINLQLPFELAGKSSARLRIETEGRDPSELVVPLTSVAPGIFTVDRTRAAVLNEDFSVNGPDNPAPRGSVVQLFATGQGLLDRPMQTGAPGPNTPPFPAPIAPVVVSSGGFPARVWFAGLAPGLIGVMQVNAEIPAAVPPSNDTAVALKVGDAVSPFIATIAVR